MKLNSEYVQRYIDLAPLPLAFERSLECQLYRNVPLDRPILDLGCGDGIFALILFAEQVDTGIDPDQGELARAESTGAYQELIRCSGGSIPKEDSQYGSVIANSVLEHIPQLDPVVREVHRVLRPGGHFYVTVPTHRFERFTLVNLLLERCGLSRTSERWRRFFNRFWHHYNVHTPDEWQALFIRAGFEVEFAKEYDPLRTCVLNDALVPFSFPGLVAKKVLHRWSFLPLSFRHALMWPWRVLAPRILRGADKADAGGLLFLSAIKPS